MHRSKLATIAIAASALGAVAIPGPAVAAGREAQEGPGAGAVSERPPAPRELRRARAWPESAGPFDPHPPEARVVKPRVTAVRDAPSGGRGTEPDCIASGASLQPRPPIDIEDDEDLSSPASGVRSGTGTAADPYVISGWFIPGQGAQLGQAVDGDLYGPATVAAISVAGTTKHILIEDNVMGGAAFPQGFDLGIAASAPNVRVERNTVCSTILEGIVANGAEGISIRDNHVVDARAAIWSVDSPGTTVAGNTVERSVFGVAVDNTEAPVVTSNTAIENYLVGVVVNFGAGAQVRDNVVRGFGPVLDGIYSEGIDLYECDGAVVTGNRVSAVGTHGLVLGYVQDGVVEGNESTANGLTGLFLWDDWVEGHNVVRGNRFSGNGSFGPGLFTFRTGIVVIDTDANLIEDNVIADNTVNGFQIYATDDQSTPDPDPTRNNIVRNMAATGGVYGFGFDLYHDEGTLLTGIEARDNAGGGISLLESGATVRDSLVASNEGTGIYLTGAGTSTVEDNVVRENERGVVLEYAQGNALRRNAMTANRRGFGMWGKLEAHFENDVDASNTVNGRPVLVLRERTGILDWAALDPGFLALVHPVALTVRNVDARGSVQGLVVFGGSGVHVEGARVDDAETGIVLSRTVDSSVKGSTVRETDLAIAIVADSDGVEVSGNTVEDAGTGVGLHWENGIPGIGLARPRQVTVSGNTLTGVTGYGVDNQGDNISILDNTIGMTSGTGVLVYSAPIVVEDNVIGGDGDRGIDIFTYFTTVRGNSVSGFDRGISVWYAAGIKVEENRLTGNVVGYYQQGSADNGRFARNVVSGNGIGMQVYGEVDPMTVECNRVTANEGDGMWFAQLTIRVKITGNLIESNGGAGLSFAGILSQVNKNRIAGNDVGVRMAGAALPSNPTTSNNIEGNTSWGMTMFTASAGGSPLVALGGAAEVATGNWWGHSSGPRATTNPLGTGDRVGDQIVYRTGAAGWLTTPDADAGSCGGSLPA